MSIIEHLQATAPRLATELTHERIAWVRQINSLRLENQAHRDKADGNYWAWQGDGEDHLESLTVPVLIRPEVLLELVRRAEASAGKDDHYAG